MKIVIQLIPCNEASCDDNMNEVKNIILRHIQTNLSYFDRDHIFNIEVLGD